MQSNDLPLLLHCSSNNSKSRLRGETDIRLIVKTNTGSVGIIGHFQMYCKRTPREEQPDVCKPTLTQKAKFVLQVLLSL